MSESDEVLEPATRRRLQGMTTMADMQREPLETRTRPSKQECWGEFWEVVGPELARLYAEGKLRGYDLEATQPPSFRSPSDPRF